LNAFTRQLPRHGFGERDDAALAGRIHSLARGADPAGVGGDVDNPTPTVLDHTRKHRVMHVQRAVKVDVNDLFPQVGIGIEKRLDHVPAGVVHQHVDRPAGLEFGDSLVNLGAVGDVHLEGVRLAARLGDQANGFLRPVFVHVKDRNLGTFFAEPFANRAPDAAAAACDDHPFSTQSSHVEVLLFR